MKYRTVTDQLNRSVTLPFPPRRIVSLVPSQTELLAWLGLEEAVVGLTRFCVHPEHWRREKVQVGGTKQVKPERIAELRPDLIIGNKEENEKDQIEALAKDYPVWLSDVGDLADALEMIRRVGALTGRQEAAGRLARDIGERFEALAREMAAVPPRRAAYLIWRRPYMVAAAGTFIDDMLRRAGFVNVFAERRRYPAVEAEALAAARPEALLLSSEPYPFREKHLDEFRLICPSADIRIVDGELFSWYGSRLLQAPAYFRKLRGIF